jgi:hypothetical protein
MQRTQIYLTEQEQAGLQRLAQAQGATVSAVIREAVDQYLEGGAEASRRRAQRLAALGIRAEKSDAEYHDLDAMAGTWSEADAVAFQTATAPFEQIDDVLWR